MLGVVVLLVLAVGLSLGLLGGGGSVLTLPILRYALGMDARQAIATSLLVVGLTSAAALIPYARRGLVDFRTGGVFGVAGMIGAYLAARVAHHIPAGLLLLGFAGMMVATAVAMIRSRSSATPRPARQAGARLPLLKILAEGLVVGAVTGLVGAGGGFLVVPALVLLGGLPMEIAVGTSLLVIAMKSFAGLSGFLAHTPINFTLAGLLTLVAVIGSVAGSALSARVSPCVLRKGFGWFVAAMACLVLVQEVPPLLRSL